MITRFRRLARRRPGSFAPLGLALALLLPSTAAPGASESLAPALSRFLAHPAFAHATWGLDIRDATTGQSLFETNRLRLLKPASNGKLFTAALALHLLGPEHRVTTEFTPAGPVLHNGTLRGDLVVRGGGDFSLSPRFHQGDTNHSLAQVLTALRNAGLRRIQGDVVADDSLFVGPPFGDGWTWDDLQYAYGAEVSALSLDDNVLEFEFHPGDREGDPVAMIAGPGSSYLEVQIGDLKTGPPGSPRTLALRHTPGSRTFVGSGSIPAGSESVRESVPVPEPALYFAHRLREELIASGIPVSGRARHATNALHRLEKGALRPAAISVPSPPLGELVTAMMKPSQNLYAQSLLLIVGVSNQLLHPHLTSEEAGIFALETFLDTAAIARSQVRLGDGSGLSRSSLVTPAAIVDLLRFMDRHRDRDTFLNSLPIAGVDGTLKARFKGTTAQGNLRAKTGSLRYVHALSGFITNTEGRRLVFSALLNGYQPPVSGPSGRIALDQLVGLLAESPVRDTW